MLFYFILVLFIFILNILTMYANFYSCKCEVSGKHIFHMFKKLQIYLKTNNNHGSSCTTIFFMMHLSYYVFGQTHSSSGLLYNRIVCDLELRLWMVLGMYWLMKHTKTHLCSWPSLHIDWFGGSEASLSFSSFCLYCLHLQTTEKEHICNWQLTFPNKIESRIMQLSKASPLFTSVLCLLHSEVTPLCMPCLSGFRQ